MDFQEELSDMLLLKMLQAATRASADKDRVREFTPSYTRASRLLALATFCSAVNLFQNASGVRVNTTE